MAVTYLIFPFYVEIYTQNLAIITNPLFSDPLSLMNYIPGSCSVNFSQLMRKFMTKILQWIRKGLWNRGLE